jgi:hypothetical protein
MTSSNRRQTAKQRRATQQLEQDAASARKAFARAEVWARGGTEYGGTLESLSASAPRHPGTQAPKRLSAEAEAHDA